MARLQIIVARARNGVIGAKGRLPWHLPEDLALFKRTTMGHPVIMGRRTWDSIGRPLPGRRNIVVTHNAHWHAEGVERASSLAQALALCGREQEAFLIGGAQLYAEALRGRVDGIYLTQIDADFAGDTWFAPLEPGRWRERSRTHYPPSGDRAFAFDFIHYEAAEPPGGPRTGEPDVH